MDNKEKEKLKKTYHDLSDDEVIDLFQTDKSEFEPGVYEIVKKEFNGRGLKKVIDEKKKLEELRRRSAKEDLVIIASFPYRHEAELTKSYLSENGVEAIIQADDAAGLRPHLTFTGGISGMAHVLVKSNVADKAKDILKIFDKEEKNKDNSTINDPRI